MPQAQGTLSELETGGSVGTGPCLPSADCAELPADDSIPTAMNPVLGPDSFQTVSVASLGRRMSVSTGEDGM